MSTLPKQTDILIVGAGPTGLAAALSLHRQGCKDLAIVDSVSTGENTSRASVVHAATLDVRTILTNHFLSLRIILVRCRRTDSLYR